MRNIKLTVQYDGSRYKGWQRLGNSDMTIQAKIENVLSKMTGEQIGIIGSGRTDAGVHALEQVANFHTADDRHTAEMMEYLNQYLPEDIVVTGVEEVEPRFHARFNVVGKTYVYRIWNGKYQNPFLRKYSTHIPEELNVEAMRRASSYFIGKHDFTSFRATKSKKKSGIRTMYSIDVKKNEQLIEMVFHGNGFLYNMVRIMAGTLIEVGLGKRRAEDVKVILEKKDRALAGPTAPSQGLFLYKVEY